MKLLYLVQLSTVYVLASLLVNLFVWGEVYLFWTGHVGLGLVCLPLGGLLVFVGSKLGFIGSKERLRNKIRDAWTEVQRLGVRCNSIQSMVNRSYEIWQGVASKGRPEEYRCDVEENKKAFQKLKPRLVSRAGWGLWLCRLYLDDYQATVDLLSLKTLFGLVAYTCENCSYEQDGICPLQDRIGDPALFKLDRDGAT